MLKIYILFLMMIITSCASNVKVAKKDIIEKNYDNMWLEAVGGKSVMAPNGYLYKFNKNGDVEYGINGIRIGKGKFLYAESETNAYYYEKISLDYVAYDVKGISLKDKVNMPVGFIIDNNKMKMTAGYTKEYSQRLYEWKKSSLTTHYTLRENKDMSEYPIPYIREIDLKDTIEFGKLR